MARDGQEKRPLPPILKEKSAKLTQCAGEWSAGKKRSDTYREHIKKCMTE